MRFVLAIAGLLAAGSVQAAGLGDALKSVPGADTAALTEAANSAMGSAAADALTVENFDPETVKQLIDQSPLEAAQKETLKQGVQAAADNPEMVEAALTQVKSALGL